MSSQFYFYEAKVEGTAYRTPLVLAATKGDLECVEILINAGADVNFRGEDAYSALHSAVIG